MSVTRNYSVLLSADVFHCITRRLKSTTETSVVHWKRFLLNTQANQRWKKRCWSGQTVSSNFIL